MKKLTPSQKALVVFLVGCFLIAVSILLFGVGKHVATRDTTTVQNGITIVDASIKQDGLQIIQVGSYLLVAGMTLALGGGIGRIYLERQTGKSSKK